jgi:hypothetical protein
MVLRFSVCVITAIFAALLATGQETGVSPRPALNDGVRTEMVRAVEDEIYDYNLQEKFRSVGKAVGSDEFQIPLFVTDDSKGSSYYVIYRLMPYGEMYRLVNIGDDGLARLFRNPRSGFPPDAPATPTVYYDDDHICQLKHDAIKLWFTVNMNPSEERLMEAIQGQKNRYGFSNLQEQRTKQQRARRGATK